MELDMLKDEVRRLRVDKDWRMALQSHAALKESSPLPKLRASAIGDTESPAVRLQRLHERNSRLSDQRGQSPEESELTIEPQNFPQLAKVESDRQRTDRQSSLVVCEPGPGRRPSYAQILSENIRSNASEKRSPSTDLGLRTSLHPVGALGLTVSLDSARTRAAEYPDDNESVGSVRCYPTSKGSANPHNERSQTHVGNATVSHAAKHVPKSAAGAAGQGNATTSIASNAGRARLSPTKMTEASLQIL